MYRFNEEKSFVDSVDNQLMVLMLTTGNYFTFNSTGTLIVKDLTAGYTPDELKNMLGLGEDACRVLDRFIAKIVENGILTETDETVEERPEAVSTQIDPADFFPEAAEYDDLQAYFMVDPIHEASGSLRSRGQSWRR